MSGVIVMRPLATRIAIGRSAARPARARACRESRTPNEFPIRTSLDFVIRRRPVITTCFYAERVRVQATPDQAGSGGTYYLAGKQPA